MNKTCNVEGCEAEWKAKGMCMTHYNRVRAHGDPRVVKKSGPPRRPELETLMKFTHVPSDENRCWEWQGSIAPNGYGTFHRGRVSATAHRASYELHIGPIPKGMHILHSCDNRKCVNPSHLSVGTHRTNMDDMLSKERHRFADKSPHSKLTSQVVREIRARRSKGETVTSLADEFGVSISTISRAATGTAWKKLLEEASS